jgi:hypothetical protein
MMLDRFRPWIALAALLVSRPALAQGSDEPVEGEPSSPHGHARGGSDVFQPPEDTEEDAPSLPQGTIDVRVVDPTGRPLPKTPVTLGVVFNSVAKGESRKRLFADANDEGLARFDHLELGSSMAYRPMVLTDGATFSAMPFRMPDRGGKKIVLHVYPVETEIEKCMVVMQSVVYTEVKDDRVQVEQAFKVYNFGRNAWVPRDVVLPLPEAFTAFTAQQGMTDVGTDAVPKKGARIRGTFAPGVSVIEFRWQLPYSGEREVAFDVGMPPRMAAARVMAPASKEMKLDVVGFPPPQSTTDEKGQRLLITERQLRKDEPALKSVSLVVSGLPGEGIGKIVATVLAAATLLAGIVLGSRKPARKLDLQAERQRHLEELEELERARARGDVGPKTYEKERRRILDAVARTFVDEEATPTHPKRARAA